MVTILLPLVDDGEDPVFPLDPQGLDV